MVNVRHYRPAGTTPDAPALALFQKQWQLYRKVRFDAANFPPSYSVDPYPDKTVQTVWQDQRRWVWFVQQGIWSSKSAVAQKSSDRSLPFPPPTLLGRLTLEFRAHVPTNGPSSADHHGVRAIRRVRLPHHPSVKRRSDKENVL